MKPLFSLTVWRGTVFQGRGSRAAGSCLLTSGGSNRRGGWTSELGLLSLSHISFSPGPETIRCHTDSFSQTHPEVLCHLPDSKGSQQWRLIITDERHLLVK